MITSAQTSSLLSEAELTTTDSQGNTRLCQAAQAQQLIGKTLTMAIQACEPQVAGWLFRRGFRLITRDIKYAFPNPGELVLDMIFKMTSKICRANLYHLVRLDQNCGFYTDCGSIATTRI